jgi:hypothetical protein
MVYMKLLLVIYQCFGLFEVVIQFFKIGINTVASLVIWLIGLAFDDFNSVIALKMKIN